MKAGSRGHLAPAGHPWATALLENSSSWRRLAVTIAEGKGYFPYLSKTVSAVCGCDSHGKTPRSSRHRSARA